ncbi:hypothetical protein AgCh_012700 [Apium graveolens]
MGIGTMSRGEKALIYVRSQYLNQCTFMPVVEEEIEEVHFEVEHQLNEERRFLKKYAEKRSELTQDTAKRRIVRIFPECQRGRATENTIPSWPRPVAARPRPVSASES